MSARRMRDWSAVSLSLLLAMALIARAAGRDPDAWLTAAPILGYRIIASYPHDPNAFTQGLIFHDGELFEGTGNYGASSLRRVDLATGQVEQEIRLASPFFGEGITLWHDRLIQLTWREHQAFIYDMDSFQRLGGFRYSGEGWGLTQDGRYWIMSDGTEVLRFLDPQTHAVVRRLRVLDGGHPVRLLNELEYIRGEVWANLWKRDLIARIDPSSGQILGYLDLTGLRPESSVGQGEGVLNGIAYDPQTNRLFVTGKYWSRLYQIAVVAIQTAGDF